MAQNNALPHKIDRMLHEIAKNSIVLIFAYCMKNNNRTFAVLVSVFFFWGFVASSNDILIPVFKEHLSLSQGKSQWIAFAFYVAYTLGSLIYLAMIRFFKFDLVKDLGYGKGIAVGLFVSTLGTLLFIPAANSGSFNLLLAGLIIVGIGFAFQQTAANPLAILLGKPETGSQRLSMAGGINNLGTTIAPLLVSYAVYGKLGSGESHLDITAVKIPYLILGGLFLIFGGIFWRLKDQSPASESDRLEASANEDSPSALTYPQLLLGMLAIFLYVGVEVSTAANLPEYLKTTFGYKTHEIAPFISLFWGSLMIGRWTSAATAFQVSPKFSILLKIVLPFVAFGIFLLVNLLANKDVTLFYPYAIMIVLLIVLDFLSKGNPAKQLLYYAIAGMVMLLLGMYIGGILGLFAFVSVGLFCSTLWPCIFTLSIKGLGHRTGQGSNYLIMMIMGGGIISVTQGSLSENPSIGIVHSFWVGVLCFAYLAFFAVAAARIFKKQGIPLEMDSNAAH
jgi:MFS transporter, FHS family, L-fucose permease